MNQAPRTLSYNPAENAVLLTSDVDGGSYELYSIPKDARGDSSPVSGVITCQQLQSC
jgi:coatomer protein complex subunit alpha (xenin)